MKTILSVAALVLFASFPLFSQSLADAARANRAKDAKPTAKRVWTDDDIQHSSPSAGTQASPTRQKNYKAEATAALEHAKGLTAREIANQIVKDIQFPGRPEWETKLYDQSQKVIAAGQKVLDVINGSGSSDQIHSTESDFDLEVWRRDQIVNDGVARAAEWTRKTERNGGTKRQ